MFSALKMIGNSYQAQSQPDFEMSDSNNTETRGLTASSHTEHSGLVPGTKRWEVLALLVGSPKHLLCDSINE